MSIQVINLPSDLWKNLSKMAVTSGRFKSVDEVYRASVAVHTVMYGFRGKESAEVIVVL